MQLPPVRANAILLKRYKRFLADVQLPDQQPMTVHCPNSGSMLGCSDPGSPVIISRSDNPNRKYPWTLEMIQSQGIWIGINTSMTNKLVHEALLNGTIDNFGSITKITPEKKVSQKSRLDFLLESAQGLTYLEVKNCSLAQNQTAIFPDAVTARGTKHLVELMHLAHQGFAAAVLFCIQRGDVDSFAPAAAIDPVYAQTLQQAAKEGVQVLAYLAEVTPEAVTVTRQVPVYVDQVEA